MKTKTIIITALLAMFCVVFAPEASAQHSLPHRSHVKVTKHRTKHTTKQPRIKKQSRRVDWSIRPAAYTHDTVVATTYHLENHRNGFRPKPVITAINTRALQLTSLLSSSEYNLNPRSNAIWLWYNSILPILGVESSDICVEIDDGVFLSIADTDNCLCFHLVLKTQDISKPSQIIGNIQGIHSIIDVLQNNGMSAKIKINDNIPISLTPSDLLDLILGNANPLNSTNYALPEDTRKTLFAPHTKTFSMHALRLVYGEAWRDSYKRFDEFFASNGATKQTPIVR